MNKRPIIQLKLSPTDRLMEMLGYLLLIAMWVVTLVYYRSLPDTIPIHFNAMGEADAYGNKSNIITLTVISTILFGLLTLLNNYPHIFNYGVTDITEENAQKHYRSATRMLRVLKLVVVLIFGWIVLESVRISRGEAEGMSIWLLPLIIVSMVIVPLVYAVYSSRA